MEYFLLALYWTLYFSLHSILASNQVKSFIILKSPGFHPFYRIFYNLCALSFLVPIFYYQRNLTAIPLFETNYITLFSGYFIAFTGLIIGYLAFKNYDTKEFVGLDYNVKSTTISNELKTTGLNKHMRHPLYFATFLIVWGYFLTSPTYALLTMCSIISIYLIIGTKLEEKKLITAFGEQYKRYIEEIPMIIPLMKNTRNTH